MFTLQAFGYKCNKSARTPTKERLLMMTKMGQSDLFAD